MQIRAVDGFVGQRLGNYHIERLLGQSRLNAVYLARDLETQRIDALTFYRVPEHFSHEASRRFLERFQQEASSIRLLKHRHILPIYAYGEQGGNPYLITPYMMNGSLASMLKRRGRFSHGQVLEILEQVASGLEYAHSRKHVHGALRPANMVVNHEKRMIVAGFGLLRMLRASGLVQGEASHLLSINGTLLVAPEYIAPEMVRGQQFDARADIYALGAIIFELLCGRPPFSGSNPLEVARQRLTQPAPSLRSICPEVPVAMESVINQALERDPARRFQRISDLVEAFAQVSVGATGHLKIVSRPAAPETPADGYAPLNQPFVTGKLPSVQFDSISKDAVSGNTGGWQLLPPIVTGKLPIMRVPPAPEEVATKKAQQADDVPGEFEMAIGAGSPDRVVAPVPPTGHGDVGVRPFDWWSMPGPIQEPLARPKGAAKPVGSPQASPQRMENSGVAGWEPMKPLARPQRRERRRAGAISRRRVVSTLVAGGVAAAGVAVFLNLGNLVGKGNGAPAQPVGGAASPTQVNSKSKQSANTVIGGPKMAINSAVDFTNPADKKPSVLIHLPDGRYVAYEKACTHVGVFVRYDATTHLLVCPAHGAIFDPANGGKVLQGPATKPLPQVKVHVRTDGRVVVG